MALSATLAAPVSADDRDDLEHRRSAVSDRIDAADASLEESSAQLVAATRVLGRAQAALGAARDRLATTRGELAVATQYDAVMQQRLDEAEARLAAAEVELADGQRAVADAETRLASFVVSSSQYGDPSVVAMDTLLTGADPAELSEGIALTDSVLGVQITSIDDLGAAKILLEMREQEVQAIRDEVELRREEAATNLQRTQELESRAEAETADVQRLVAQRATARREAARARAADLARLRALEAERDRIGDRLRRIARRESMPSISYAGSATSGATPSISDTGSGYLSAPVSAPITSPYGMRMHPILQVLKLHDGTDFGVGCGTPVRAAAAGQVVSTAYSEGYGNQLVLSNGTVNGSPLATSYSHLTSFAAASGERVGRGELIGYAGTTGYSTGCHLHFMVYVNGTPVDPMGWL